MKRFKMDDAILMNVITDFMNEISKEYTRKQTDRQPDNQNKQTTHDQNRQKRMEHYAIKDVRFFDDKTTVVFWKDGTKTIAVCKEDDTFNPWTGLAIAISKKALGNKGFRDVFETYIPDKYRSKKS